MGELLAVSPDSGYNPTQDIGLFFADSPRANAEYMCLLSSPVFRGRGVPRGDGHSVLLLPGLWGKNDGLLTMAGWLERIGYEPLLVKRFNRTANGADIDHPEYDTAAATNTVLEHTQDHPGNPLTIIGHSKGGMLAHEITQELAENEYRENLDELPVRQVITLGTPSSLPRGADYHKTVTPMLHWYVEMLQKRAGNQLQRGSQPLPRTVLSTRVYSKLDPVAYYKHCQDKFSTNIEVHGSHTGLVANREVYQVVAQRLPEVPQRMSHPALETVLYRIPLVSAA